MADNSWNTLTGEINQAMSDMNAATSKANGAAGQAQAAAEKANTAATGADNAATAASTAASRANLEAEKWEGATVSAEKLDAGAAPTVQLAEKDGVKNLTYGIPVGKDGAQGPKGDQGKSGVTFELVGTKLYITTEE